jgi:type III secretion system (T3SS) chaperone YscW
MRATRALALWLAGVSALAGCTRQVPEPRGELTGAWLREPELARGFELRSDGSLALLGLPERSGLAWNASHGELVLSTNSASHVESQVARLRIAALEPERLELAADGEPFAGRYRRGQAAHVRGVVTYRERIALPPDARVLVELTQSGVGPVATQAFLAHSQVPIGFDLSFVPQRGARYLVTARIADRERTWFVSPAPAPAAPGDDQLELFVARAAR